MKKIKWVDNPKQILFSYWSIKAKALGVAIPISWAVLPEAWQKAYFPDWVPQSMAYVTGAFLFVSLLCQFIKQDLPEPKE
jgi:hypothetical protein